MAERHSEHSRASDDWYVEPAWCVEVLLDRVEFIKGFHDPCCGLGTIPLAGRARGLQTSGNDLRTRAPGWGCQDFLTDFTRHADIVTNPPFAIAVEILNHALAITIPGGRVAALVQAKFLFSQKRQPLFHRSEMERVIILSKRPSMPPGEMLLKHGEAVRRNGSLDFLWAIWRVGRPPGPPTIEWALA